MKEPMDLGPNPMDPHGDGTIRPGDPVYEMMMSGDVFSASMRDDGLWDVEFQNDYDDDVDLYEEVERVFIRKMSSDDIEELLQDEDVEDLVWSFPGRKTRLTWWDRIKSWFVQ